MREFLKVFGMFFITLCLLTGAIIVFVTIEYEYMDQLVQVTRIGGYIGGGILAIVLAYAITMFLLYKSNDAGAEGGTFENFVKRPMKQL